MLARSTEERLKYRAKRSGKRRNVGLLADESPSNQDLIGTDAGLGGAQFGDGSDAWRDLMADAVDLGAAREPRPRIGR